MNFRNTIDQLRQLKQSAKSAWRWKRFNFSEVPCIFGNAMPKSGSHLVLQVLQGLTGVAPFRYITPNPTRTITAEGRLRSSAEILADLKHLKFGAIGWGYLRSTPENRQYIKSRQDLHAFFVYRDPRDRLISSIFYAVDIHKAHAQHDFYASLPMDERVTAAIQGRDEPGLLHLPNVREHYERYLGWLKDPQVLCLRFEDLIQDTDRSLTTLLDFIESRGYQLPTPRDDALAIIKEAIQPKKSPTFRKGKAGGWREHFTEDHKRLFKEVTGDLLIQLGYETDHDW